MSARAALALTLLVALAGCVSVEDARLYACGPDRRCPEGFVCRNDDLCHRGEGAFACATNEPRCPTGQVCGANDLCEPAPAEDAGTDAGVDAGTDAGSCLPLSVPGCDDEAGPFCCAGTFCVAGTCKYSSDSCADAIAVTGWDAGMATLRGTTVGAVNDVSLGTCSAPGPDVFYSFTGAGDLLAVATRNDGGVPPVLALTRDCSGGFVACASAAGANTSLSHSGLAPAKYRLVVDSADSTTGDFTVQLTGTGAFPLKRGDLCEDALGFAIPPDGGIKLANDLGPTVAQREAVSPCDAGLHDLVYTFAVTKSGQLGIDVPPDAGLDVVVGLARGTSCGALTAISCANAAGLNGTETISAPVTPGQYYLFVSGSNDGGTGRYNGFVTLP